MAAPALPATENLVFGAAESAMGSSGNPPLDLNIPA